MNIKEYYGFKDTKYTEYQIYYWFKNNTSWKLLVLKVRLIELIYTMFPVLFKLNIYPTDLINMVNKWENK